MAIDGLSWNRWFVHGNGYGLNGYVEPHTEVQPVELTMPMFERPRPVTPVGVCPLEVLEPRQKLRRRA